MVCTVRLTTPGPTFNNAGLQPFWPGYGLYGTSDHSQAETTLVTMSINRIGRRRGSGLYGTSDRSPCDDQCKEALPTAPIFYVC
ncbi:hypothetical protein BN8_02848 [Fibrisoma limi BUZ 3]|uniref:Uncharacterized protein n=1 Tax=Fibrisoma limi BUZ 3 TaxID=1185876 RepID=I2GIK6_9BACT|nr:hypothetical protein BN8_02848 [Fibrisoma limi BUZ 3]